MKKKNLTLVLAAFLTASTMGLWSDNVASAQINPADANVSIAKALLKQGNAEYLANDKDKELRKDLVVNGQHPYAIVITCADSRAVPEIAFNAKFGDIFTIRNAGNVISDFELGSVEYGAEHLGATLVVVMGHTNCGAVTTACSEGEGIGERTYIDTIVDDIKPSVEKAKKNGSTKETLLADSIVLNVENSINKLKTSHVLQHLAKEGKLEIVGAIYDIESGKVTFLD